MKAKPPALIDSIAWNLARMPVSSSADRETRETIAELRKRFEMQPDLTKRGDQ